MVLANDTLSGYKVQNLPFYALLWAQIRKTAFPSATLNHIHKSSPSNIVSYEPELLDILVRQRSHEFLPGLFLDQIAGIYFHMDNKSVYSSPTESFSMLFLPLQFLRIDMDVPAGISMRFPLMYPE